MQSFDSQGGFSLIEVLVALFVLAIGLLGMAGLQATAQRATADSGNLGRATRLAYDMGDRLRQEVPGSTTINTFIAQSVVNHKTTDSAACYDTSGCTGTAAATAYIAEWQRLLQELPNGQGLICRDATPYAEAGCAAADCSGNATDQLVVKVCWQSRDTQRTQATGVVTQRVVSVVGL